MPARNQLASLWTMVIVLLLVVAIITTAPVLVAAQCTLTWTSSSQLVLSNTLLSVKIDVPSAKIISFNVITSSLTKDVVAGSYANFDYTPGTYIQPYNAVLTVERQSSSFIQVALAQSTSDSTYNYGNFIWSARFAIQSGLRGLYVWHGVRHPAGAANGTLGLIRHIFRWASGTSPSYTDRPFTSIYVPQGSVLHDMPNYAQAVASTELWPGEATLITVNSSYSYVDYKYSYSVDHRFHDYNGWLSTDTKLGVWLISPSFEYHNGGPDCQSLTTCGGATHCHVPHSDHYGSGSEFINQNEDWYKLFGPWLVYANVGTSVQNTIDDAARQTAVEKAAWPYWFVGDSWYAAANRFTVSGTFTVDYSGECAGWSDTIDSTRATLGMTWKKSFVFLTAPTATNGDYRYQSKGYFYWAYVQDDGTFSIPNVAAGTYELHAWSDGAIGEYVHPTTFTLSTSGSSRTYNIGAITFVPPRVLPTLFMVGFPDRTAREYLMGDRYREWGLFYKLSTYFPNGVTYNVGAAGTCYHAPTYWRTRLYLMHVGIGDNYNISNAWTYNFYVPTTYSLSTYAYLRLAIAGSVYCAWDVYLNGNRIALVNGLPSDMSVYRSGIHGIYTHRLYGFRSSFFNTGSTLNVLQFWNIGSCNGQGRGIMLDAFRIEA